MVDVEALSSRQTDKQGDKRYSACSLPDEPYSFVIYGHKIHDSRIIYVRERYRIFGIELGNERFLFDGGVLSKCQLPRWKHAFYGMFSSGLIPMGNALYTCISLSLVRFLPLICGRLLADLDLLSHVLNVIIYSDLRDNNIMESSTK